MKRITNRPPFIQVYPDKAGGWRWRAVANNGRTVASSGEAYYSKYNAMRAAKSQAKRYSWRIIVTPKG